VAQRDGTRLLAVGRLPILSRTPADAQVERRRTQKWAQAIADKLRFTSAVPIRRHRTDEQEQAAMRAWQGLLALDHVLQGQRFHREPEKNRRRILRAAADVLGAKVVIWVPSQDRTGVLAEGEAILSSWDCGQLADRLKLEPGWREDGFILRNELPPAEWGSRFAAVENVLALPLAGTEPQGWVIAVNKQEPGAASAARSKSLLAASESRPFSRVDAALLSPFAALLGLNVRTYERHVSLKELLVGLTRALTSAIDAKDPYTYGHSERVARIAVMLGQDLGLRTEELSDIYLAGLLHDIGKIGIRDSVLGKREPLTGDEIAHLRQHVVIGHRILTGLKPIGHLLPGVLNHHERYDGAGYPEGLAGDMIPFLARIIAVADSYDAMSTNRPYRSALAPPVIEQTMNNGSGSQWDPRVVEAFGRCRAKIHAIRQRGLGESLRGAIDDAMRYQDSHRAGE
jgi:HD-GYP domain-containing protein (c-di-GMP phosphodiesterase class II)